MFVGFIPPVNTMPKVGSLPVEAPAYPLEMLRCTDCGLVQIGLEVSQEILFPESYPYLSGSTRILRTNFANLKDESEQLRGSRNEVKDVHRQLQCQDVSFDT